MKNSHDYTVYDYLEWRGDLTFLEAPFNPVDNLIFSIIAYFDIDDYMDEGTGREKSIREIIEEYEAPEEEKKRLISMSPYLVYKFVEEVSKTRRFGDINICFYENIINEEMYMQFSAMTFVLPDKSLYIAFRGTDDTLIGWREDFMMSMGPVEAQLYATKYLAKVSSNYFYKKIRVGGHSKGGNLAVWSVVHSTNKVKNRIISVYSNDSPGFNKEIVESEQFKELDEKLEIYVVSKSIVGMFFHTSENSKIIDSIESGVLQHDPFSWKLLGNDFVYLSERAATAQKADEAIEKWIESLDDKERAAITDIVFTLLESTGAKTVTDIRKSKVQTLELIKNAIFATDKKSKGMIFQVIKRIFE